MASRISGFMRMSGGSARARARARCIWKISAAAKAVSKRCGAALARALELRPEDDRLVYTGAEADGIANYMINMPPGRSYAEYYANPQVAEKIASIARRLRPDIAHLHCVQEIGADCVAALKAQGLPVILSTHPRTRKRLDTFGISFDARVQDMKPFGFHDYNHLQMNAFCAISDGGTKSFSTF